MKEINIDNFIVSENELKDLGLDKEIIIPGLKEDKLALNGVSDFEDYISLDSEHNFVPGFEESSSFDSEDYDTYNDPLN
tara:strand:- start:175 stop:411 length:237 start_codon:yes stop_codon:yes gene_type:complete